MAEKIELQVKLDEAKTARENIVKAGGFSGAAGAKNLAKLDNLLGSISKMDLGNLKGKDLDNFLNALGKIRSLLDSGAKSLTNYSKEYITQQQKTHEANVKLTKSQDKLNEALRKQEQALQDYKKALSGKDKYSFFEKDSGKKIPNSQYNRIAKQYEAGNLGIQSGETKLSGQSYQNAVKGLGLAELASANQAVTVSEQAVKADKVTLQAEELKLANTPTGGTASPVAVETFAQSQATNKFISDVKTDEATKTRTATNLTAQDIEDTTKALDKQGTSLGRAFKQFTIYAVALRTAKKAVREAVKTIKDLDKYLTEQAMVTGKTRKETYGLLTSYQALAKQLGSTTKEVASVATQYMRQGKSTEEALKLTEAAVSAAKVAGISAGESVTYLTTALNGFQLSANEAMKVSDKFAAIAAQSASSYEELAIALSKVASQANLAGMSIDYTTALLAKGLETTREAPETIGTALKTVIARMREMGDYGTTLEGDTDVNNVESQLAYVGIALKNNRGELRSTEEVLDELGKKWDELSVNQQAAIAKALAGTRQQSRLIAMMQDYERVTELQDIAQRSQGATLAQMETYLQGMDAALNKVSVAWEKIVTAVTDSDSIIKLIDFVAGFLETLSDFLSTDWGLEATLTVIATLTAATLGNKLQELIATKTMQKYEREALKIKLKGKQTQLEALIAQQKALVLANKDAAVAKRKAAYDELDKKIKDKTISQTQIAAEKAKIELEYYQEVGEAEAKLAEYQSEALANETQLTELGATELSQYTGMASTVGIIFGGIMSLVSGSQAWLIALTLIGIALKGIPIAIKAITLAQKVSNKEEGKGMFAGIVSAFSSAGIPGVIAGIALATALVAGLGLGIFAIASAAIKTQETTDEKIDNMSASIYNLEKSASAIDTVVSKFEDLDNKVIKTKEDIDAMNDTLNSAADNISNVKAKDEDIKSTDDKKYKKLKEKQAAGTATKDELDAIWSAEHNGQSKREWYNNLSSDAEKKDFLKKESEANKEAADKIREAQMDTINEALEEKDKEGNAKHNIDEYTSEINAVVNSKLYQAADSIGAARGSTNVVQSLIGQMSAQDQKDLYSNPEKITSMLKQVESATMKINGEEKKLADVLESDDYSFAEKVQAYTEMMKTFGKDSSIGQAFASLYHELGDLINVTNGNTTAMLNYIDSLDITTDKIDKFQESMKDLGYEDKWKNIFNDLANFTDVETGIVDIQAIIHKNFGNIKEDSEEYAKILNTIEKLIGETTLNIGQTMTKTQNQISSVYETATKWSTMSSADQASFLSENAKLFEDNPELYRAFQTGDFAKIEQALKNSKSLQDDVAAQIKTINSQLAIEEARVGDARNEALIQYLKDQKAILEDTNNLYKASLDVRLDQEKKQLDIYKEYLKKQQEALTKALEDRKDAYSKYFEAVNQEAEDEEYEDKANLLATNLSKLATSDNAASKQQTKELEKQLQELENERLKELRQRAQEAVLENLDDQVEEINKKFDKLLENNQNLLAAMLVDENNKDDFIANMVSSNVAGMTANEAQKWMTEDFMTTFGSLLPKEALTEIEKTVNDVINLNVEGNNVQLSAQQQNQLREAIMKALQQIGYN